MGDLLATIIAATLFSVGASGLLVFLVRTWIGERLRASIQHEYDQKLETYKAELAARHDSGLERVRPDLVSQQSIQAAAQSGLLVGRRAAYQHRLKAVEEVWKSLVRLRDTEQGPGFLTFTDMLVPAEYEHLLTNTTVRPAIEAWDEQKLLEFLMRDAEEIDNLRPFCGELLYQLHWTYRAIVGRVCLSFVDGVRNGRFSSWHDDQHLKSLLTDVLGEKAVEEYDNLQSQWYSWITDSLVRRILLQMAKIIDGQEEASAVMEEAKRISDRLREFERASS